MNLITKLWKLLQSKLVSKNSDGIDIEKKTETEAHTKNSFKLHIPSYVIHLVYLLLIVVIHYLAKHFGL